MADSSETKSASTCRLTESSVNCRNISSCSVSSLSAITDQCRATGRIRRDFRSQAEEAQGQACIRVLTKSLNIKLNQLELIPITQNRPTVITPTPPTSPVLARSSTPTTSQLAPPIPPRNCVSEGLHIIHDSSCSDISSIGGDVFENNADGKFIQPDIVEPVQSFIHQNPFSLRTPSVQITSSTMEAVVVNINRKIKKFGLRISTYTAEQLTSGTLQYHMSEMNDVQTIYEDLSIDISEFLDNYRPNLSEEDIQRWDAVLVELQSKRSSSAFFQFLMNYMHLLYSLTQYMMNRLNC